MTIREHFQRFHKRVTYFAVIAVVLMTVSIDLLYPDLTRRQHLLVGLGMAVPVFLALLLIFKGRFKCPRCGVDFNKLRRAQMGRFTADTRMYWEVWEACPNCAVSFDAPYSTNVNR